MAYKKKTITAGLAANVSTLKVHLGQYLRKVKQGAEVIILDRQLPVAKIVAYQEEALIEKAPTLTWQQAMAMLKKSKTAAKTKLAKKTSLDYLIEDRGSDE